MKQLSLRLPQKKLHVLLVVIPVLALLGRVLWFAGHTAGIEHDSGWYLGVARNLANHGIYASSTNTTIETGVGTKPSIHGRPIVQDEIGYTYFPASITVGPGYLFPQALILRLFRSGWMQYRLWPELCYVGLLTSCFLILYHVSVVALVLFFIWLWLLPQFTVQFAFESLSEHIALFYLILSFYFCASAIGKRSSHSPRKLYLLAGLFFSFSFLTKSLALLSAVGFAIYFPWLWWSSVRKAKKAERKKFFVNVGWFSLGAIVPIVAYHFYRFGSVYLKFGGEGFKGINEDLRLHYLEVGSGLSRLGDSFKLIPHKVSVWLDVGFQYSVVPWALLLVAACYLWRNTSGALRSFWILCYGAMLGHFGWFVVLTTDPFARYAWQVMFLAMMGLCLATGMEIDRLRLSKKKKPSPLFVVCLLAFFASQNYSLFDINPKLDATTVARWKEIRNIRQFDKGFPSLRIMNRSHQQETVDFIQKQFGPNDHLYYIHSFVVAEMSALTDRIFFPVSRHIREVQKGNSRGNPFVIFGPYQFGEWAVVPPEYLVNFGEKVCERWVFENPSYKICSLRKFEREKS